MIAFTSLEFFMFLLLKLKFILTQKFSSFCFSYSLTLPAVREEGVSSYVDAQLLARANPPQQSMTSPYYHELHPQI